MGTPTDPSPVGAAELLMRKVPAHQVPIPPLYFDPVRPAESPSGVTFLAFQPTREDDAGPSVSRTGHTLIRERDSKIDKPTRNSHTLTLARECCLRVVGPYNCNGEVADRFTEWSAP
jgi:hypothetical protein